MKSSTAAYAEHLLENMNWPEKILWSRLRAKKTGYSFQRQAIVCGYIADFYCPAAKLVVEVDGGIHREPQVVARDIVRDETMQRHGFEVLRFQVSDVMKGMSAVLIRIWLRCDARAPIAPKHFFKGKGKSRHSESVEFSALADVQEARRKERHAQEFSDRYWKKRELTVHKRSKRSAWWKTPKSE